MSYSKSVEFDLVMRINIGEIQSPFSFIQDLNIDEIDNRWQSITIDGNRYQSID